MDIAQKIKFNFMILEMRFLRLIDKYLILSISFKKNKNAHLALGVIGDHYFMGTPPMFANIESHIRNIFIGNVPKILEEKKKTIYKFCRYGPNNSSGIQSLLGKL